MYALFCTNEAIFRITPYFQTMIKCVIKTLFASNSTINRGTQIDSISQKIPLISSKDDEFRALARRRRTEENHRRSSQIPPHQMLRLRLRGRPRSSHRRRDPSLDRVQAPRPDPPDRKRHRRKLPAADQQRDSDRRRVGEESELRVDRLRERDDDAVLPRRGGRGVARAAGDGEGAAVGGDQRDGGDHGGSDHVAAGSGCGYRVGSGECEQRHAGWRENRLGDF